MDPFKIDTVHHIAVVNTNYEKSYDFYVNKLGLKVIFDVERPQRGDRVIMLELAHGAMLELIIMPGAPARTNEVKPVGAWHLAFHVEDVPQAVQWLNNRGIETDPILVNTTNGWNKRIVFFYDPDGTPLELHE